MSVSVKADAVATIRTQARILIPETVARYHTAGMPAEAAHLQGVAQALEKSAGWMDRNLNDDGVAMAPSPVAKIGAADLEAVQSLFEDGYSTWLAVMDRAFDPYILSTSEDGDVFYVGIPRAEDEGGTAVNQNRGLLTNPGQDTDGPRWPLRVLGSDDLRSEDEK